MILPPPGTSAATAATAAAAAAAAAAPPLNITARKPSINALSASTILEALSQTRHGLCLTDLSHVSGLARTSAHYLVEHLVRAGAVRRVDRRYYIASMTGHLDRRRQLDSLLRQVCADPIRRLSSFTGAAASVYVRQFRRARLVTAAAPAGQAWVPPGEFDLRATPYTAVGLVLLAAHPHAARPTTIPQTKWQMWRRRIRDDQFVITGSDCVPEGCCCAAAPIWSAGGDCVGAAAVLPRTAALSDSTIDLLLDTTHRIRQALPAQRGRSPHQMGRPA